MNFKDFFIKIIGNFQEFFRKYSEFFILLFYFNGIEPKKQNHKFESKFYVLLSKI